MSGDDGIWRVDTDRHVRGTPARSVLGYVRRVLGEDTAAQVLADAASRDGFTGPPQEWLADWMAPGAILALAAVASEVCNDADIGRRAGEENMRTMRKRGIADFLRASGSVDAALAACVDGANKNSDGRIHELTAVGEGAATISATYVPPGWPHPFFCSWTAGFFGQLPSLFGFDGVIAEHRCMVKGDESCVYELRWSVVEAGAQSATGDVTASRERTDGYLERFEQLHTMATELAQAEDIETLLERITDRASTAVKARRHILVVRPEDDGELQVHHRGFAESQVPGCAERLLAGDLAADDCWVVADVESGDRHYGHMAALYPRGSTATETERRLLGAYARHAAAALDAVASLERARDDRDTAQTLLQLSRALAEVGTRSDVAQRVAAAVPGVTHAEAVGVWLWDPIEEGMRLEAQHPEGPGGLPDAFFPAAEHVVLIETLRDADPFVVDLDHALPEFRQQMEMAGTSWSAVAPIRIRGEFLGLVAAGYTDGNAAADPALLERLRGLADLAATALDNAALLERVRAQSLHDTLTGLPNRALMEDRAGQALVARSRTGERLALLFIDLDRFKNVNDTLGHGAGDELICQAADRLRATLRSSDTLARLGGDEFVILLPKADAAGAAAVAEQAIAALTRPFHLSAGTVFISCSIGIASAPDHGTDYDTLLRHADGAMYSAKEAGRGTFAIHAADTAVARRERLDLESGLHLAVERGELAVAYQPQIDLATLRVTGVEALVRWDHPTFGRLEPDRFMSIAEESGMVAQIDDWVREVAFAQARLWMERGTPLRMTVNLSMAGLREPALPARIAELLDRHALDPALIELEITERATAEVADPATLLSPLRALGVRLAIDDFGVGSAVLARLHRCPVDTVKLDESIVQGITSLTSEAPMVTALLAMSASLGLDAVAEGVESTAQVAFLRRHGCRSAQGYYFSPPIDGAEIEQLVRRQRVTGPDADVVRLSQS